MKAEEYLRQFNIKVTKGRIRVLDCFLEKNSPMTAEELYFILRDEDVKVDLSTIYRTLDVFETKNIVNKIIGENGTFKFILKKNVHKHKIQCSICHKEVEYECPMPQIEEILRKETGFYVTCGDITLEGICHKCKEDKNSNSDNNNNNNNKKK
ncbi:Fe2+ or Zn2+ uptake regulation protein [Hathewaya proteolytica DSM 3090]|uniref:Fe2+ or Zn2+ uptake regulation protein n=1 Tax=Hathewaya proteolytica DSM 3090 TaxID=1121331 RepID=A0A1M6KLP3_9CLOT|nr:Fur family transcriptional regulator [Hathewaya proteolytica]SHJ59820.1 Fe2+ or Zn2+ uptake regulation protein [Hathewaya proteolytica DSM 3090]